MSNSYDKKALIRYLIIFGIVVAMMKAIGGAGFIVVAPLILAALSMGKYEDLLFYLILTGTIVVGNSALIPKNMIFFITQRVIMATLAGLLGLQVFGRRVHPVLKPFYWIVFYAIFMLLPSFVGWCPIISYLKLLLFSLCFFAYFGVAARLSNDGRINLAKIRSVMLTFAVVYIGGSIAVIPFPAISQLSGQDYVDAMLAGRDITSLFTGMTNQSQCLGPVICCIACILLGDMFFGLKRWDKLYVGLLICCPYLIYKTSSRTAAGTFMIAVLTQFYFMMKARGIRSRWKSRIVSMGFAVVAGAALFVLISSGLRQGALRFILKTGNDDARAEDISFERVTSSRQGLVETSLANFKDSPLIGNGFQVSKAWEGVQIQSFKQALSAPIEKGVWVAAVLEEGGVVGFSIFCIFIMVTVFSLTRMGAYMSCGMFITFIVSNLGEFTFFSMSYLGGFMWAMLFLALIMDMSRLRHEMQLRKLKSGILGPM